MSSWSKISGDGFCVGGFVGGFCGGGGGLGGREFMTIGSTLLRICLVHH